jgi:transcriptional regulator with XRE-family HTH domain
MKRQRIGVELGQRIRILRDSRGLTQSELAGLTRKSVETISNIERGRTIPSVRTLAHLAEILQVELIALFDTRQPSTATGSNAEFGPRLRALSEDDIQLVSDFIDLLRKRARPRGRAR